MPRPWFINLRSVLPSRMLLARCACLCNSVAVGIKVHESFFPQRQKELTQPTMAALDETLPPYVLG